MVPHASHVASAHFHQLKLALSHRLDLSPFYKFSLHRISKSFRLYKLFKTLKQPMCRHHGKMMRSGVAQCKTEEWPSVADPYQTWRLFETEILTSTGSYITFNWLIFLMKRASHFSTELNSRDIQKCNCFWVPSYDLDPPTKNSGICPWP